MNVKNTEIGSMYDSAVGKCAILMHFCTDAIF